MEVIRHDVWTATKAVTRLGWTVTKPVARLAWNYPGRYALGWTGRAVEGVVAGTGLAAATGVKFLGEHTLKFGWQGVKGLGYLGGSAINAVATHPRLFARPAGPFAQLPHWERHNWGNPANPRPPGMDWWRDPANGNWRIRHLPLLPIPPRWEPPRDDTDEYDPMNAYKGTRPHSLQWYMAHSQELARQAIEEAKRLNTDYITPYTNGAGNYTDNRGNVLLDNAGNPMPMANPAGGINPPPDAALRSYDMYRDLTSPDQDVRNRAHQTLINETQWIVQLKDLEQTQHQEWEIGVEANGKIQHELERLHAQEEWNKFIEGLRTGSYGADDAFMKIPKAIAEIAG